MIRMLKTRKIKDEVLENIEFCVTCGIKTEYKKDDPIRKRIGYIPGAGQLCRKCYQELYPKGTVNYD